MNLGKKIIALSLVAVMSLQTVNASVIDRALSNYTPPQTATITDSEGNTVKSMFYSGSFYYRFVESATPQLLWSFSPPEIEVGCNGFNLKGMFMSLLGIDQFGSMLQNAGTSLAWGVAIGLIYSLPGVASVFKFINQWAKDIQKLLGNACQSGIAIGQAIAANSFGPDVQNFEKDIDKTLSSWTLAGSKQDGSEGIASKLGLKDYGLAWEDGLSFVGKDTVSDAVKKDAFAGSLSKLFRSHSVGATILLKQIERKNQIVSKFETVINQNKMQNAAMVPVMFPILYDGVASVSGGVDSNFTNIDIDFLSKNTGNPDDQTTFGLKMLAYAFLYNMVGDMGYSNTDLDSRIKKVNQAFNCSGIVAGTNKNNCPGGADEYKRILREFISEGSGTLLPIKVGGGIQVSPDKFYDAIVDGLIDSKDTYTLKAPMMYMIAIKTSDKAEEYDYLLFPTTDNKEHQFFGSNTPFPGLRDISKCSLYNVLKSQGIPTYQIDFVRNKELKSSSGGSSNKLLDCEEMVDTTRIDASGATTTVKVGKYPVLLYGDITTAASLISKLKPDEIMHMVSVFEHVNTYMLVRAFSQQLANVLGDMSINSNVPLKYNGTTTTNESSIAQNINPLHDMQQVGMTAIITQWATIYKEFYDKMKVQFANQIDSNGFIEIMRYYEKIVQERAYKNNSN